MPTWRSMKRGVECRDSESLRRKWKMMSARSSIVSAITQKTLHQTLNPSYRLPCDMNLSNSSIWITLSPLASVFISNHAFVGFRTIMLTQTPQHDEKCAHHAGRPCEIAATSLDDLRRLDSTVKGLTLHLICGLNSALTD